MKIAILGAGESGLGAALLGKHIGAEVWLSDKGQIADQIKETLSTEHIAFEEGRHTETSFFDADVIVKSPGIPDTVPLLQRLREAGKSIISEIEFASRYTEARIIAITGSNGKTTTTSLMGHLMASAGRSVTVAGNIGPSFARKVVESQPDWFVLEVSSFQLDGIESFRPDIALLLNITPDHLDRYGYQMEAYAAAKFRIAENQQPEDVFIYSTDDPWTLKQWPDPAPLAEKKGFGTGKAANAWVDHGKLCMAGGFEMDWEEVPMMGRHNQRNALAALLAVQEAGLTHEEMKAGLKSFAPIEHRLEPVGSLDAVEFINDSKATNVDAVYYALEAMKKPVIWMAGGVDKGNDYQVLKDLVQEKVKGIVVLGSGYEELNQVFSGPMIQTGGIKEAVETARKWAEAGDAVLLSPACASFDLFRNYIDRGDQFRAEVHRLISEQETHKP